MIACIIYIHVSCNNANHSCRNGLIPQYIKLSFIYSQENTGIKRTLVDWIGGETITGANWKVEGLNEEMPEIQTTPFNGWVMQSRDPPYLHKRPPLIIQSTFWILWIIRRGSNANTIYNICIHKIGNGLKLQMSSIHNE